IYLLD
ncbi:hypothetical protein ACTFIV_011323, partial [Dictyostelium citrinum]